MSRRIRIRGYKGEKVKKYHEWLNEHSGVGIPPQQEWDGSQPWSKRQMSPLEEDYIEALEKLYPTLKGRQKQIVELLFEYKTGQSEIARKLGMKQPNVAKALRAIEKKLKKLI